MEDDQVEEIIELSDSTESSTSNLPDAAESPRNHHPRKLPNIPRNPEIYQPSPGIFKYIRKDSRAVTGPVGNSKQSKMSSAKTVQEELSVLLECYDEATHNANMAQRAEQEEEAAGRNHGNDSPKRNGSAFPIDIEASTNKPQEAKPIDNSVNCCDKQPSLSYKPPKLDSSRLRRDVLLPTSSSVFADVQPLLPTDSDNFYTLRTKLNSAMHQYTLQRRQLMKLSGRVKNLARTNERLTERAQGMNIQNRLSPCLATDTKYIILFENLVNPEAMNNITKAMNASENVEGSNTPSK